MTESTIAKLQGRIDELRKSPTLGFTTFLDTAQISALQSKIDELARARDQTQARIAFLEGPPEHRRAGSGSQRPPPMTPRACKDRAERLERIAEGLESTLFGITHQGSERIIAEHERRVVEIEALRAKDGSNAEAVERLIGQSAAVREAQLSQLRTKEVEAADKVRGANERVVEGLNAERAALTSTERERFVAQALSRLSAEATGAAAARGGRSWPGAVRRAAGAPGAQRLMDEGRSVIDRSRTATEQYAAEIAKLNELLAGGRDRSGRPTPCVEDANDRALRSSQAWTDGATGSSRTTWPRATMPPPRPSARSRKPSRGAEDALVGFITTGKLEIQGLADSILADLTRTTVRQTHHGPDRRFSAERVRRRRPVRPVPRGRHRR